MAACMAKNLLQEDKVWEPVTRLAVLNELVQLMQQREIFFASMVPQGDDSLVRHVDSSEVFCALLGVTKEDVAHTLELATTLRYAMNWRGVSFNDERIIQWTQNYSDPLVSQIC
jgi:hypothetical protein